MLIYQQKFDALLAFCHFIVIFVSLRICQQMTKKVDLIKIHLTTEEVSKNHSAHTLQF